MKCNILSTFGLVIALFVPFLCFSEPPNPMIWKPLNNNYYYNKTIITKAPDILLVWTYKAVTTDYRIQRTEELKMYDTEKSRKYDGFHHETFLWEIDCSNKRIRMEEFIDFDKSGKVLDRYRYDNPGWEPVYPKTGGDVLFQRACFPMKVPLKKMRAKSRFNSSP